MAGEIEIRPVDFSNKKQVKTFIKFPWKVYKNNQYWVPPLIIDHLEFFNPGKNPYFLHSKAQLYLAYRNNELVGRISAHENNMHIKVYNDGVGFFGFFECIDDQKVADALFDTASGWLCERGLKIMRGPISFSLTTDELGLLMDAYDQSPVIRMTYNPPYYVKLIENYGFKKSEDLNAYQILKSELPELVDRAADFALEDPDLVVRNFNFKNFKGDAEKVCKIYSEAWSENWGATPLTDEEYHHMTKALKLIIDPDMVFLAEYRGEPAGVSMVFPDLNQAIKLANGRLLPFGLLKILLHRKKIKTLRIPVMGVLKKYRQMGIDAVFYTKTYKIAKKKGYESGELSWIRASDKPLNSMLKRVGAEIYKIYRIYDKSCI